MSQSRALSMQLAQHATDVFFVVAFLFPLIVVVGYRMTKVRARLAEVEKVLFADGLEPETEKWNQKEKDHPAWLLAGSPPDTSTAQLKKAVKQKFLRIHGLHLYAIPMLLTLVLSAAGLWLCREWVHSRWFPPVTASLGRAFPDTMSPAVIMALAGAYVWGVWELLNRRSTGDLTPSELYEVAFRWAVAIPIGHAFSLLVVTDFRPAMAFAAAAFPLKDIRRLIQEWSLKKVLEKSSSGTTRPEQRHLGTSVEGVSDATLTRLEELGIVTAPDMAYADAMRVMIRTGYPFQNVIDWMDQSLLSVYVGDQRKAFRDAGLRCSIDICEFVELHGIRRPGRESEAETALRALSQAVGMAGKSDDRGDPQGTLLLADLLMRVQADPQVQMLFKLWYPKGLPETLRGLPDNADASLSRSTDRPRAAE